MEFNFNRRDPGQREENALPCEKAPCCYEGPVSQFQTHCSQSWVFGLGLSLRHIDNCVRGSRGNLGGWRRRRGYTWLGLCCLALLPISCVSPQPHFITLEAAISSFCPTPLSPSTSHTHTLKSQLQVSPLESSALAGNTQRFEL